MCYSNSNSKFLIFIIKLLVVNLTYQQLGIHGLSTVIDDVRLLRKSRAIITRALNKGVCGIQNYTGKIRGGLITELDEFPWNVLLIYEKTGGMMEHGCGGVLIEVSSFCLTIRLRSMQKYLLDHLSQTTC